MNEERYAEPVLHRAADGIVTMEWPGDERFALCAREIVEQFVETTNANVRLESRNQALQERIEELKTLLHEERLTRYKAEAALERAWKHEEESHAYCSGFSPALERTAISPTQETDPE